MPIDFSALKNSRKSQFDALATELAKLSNPSDNSGDDARFWKPTVDKAGNGFAVIRFLPAPPGEDVPFVRLWDHGFQGPGGWYIEKSLTTLGLEDPCSEYNSKLWNTGIESNKDIVRKQKRRLYYISNIEVIQDPGNPAAEGKQFLFQYGKKIFDKANDLMHPTFPGDVAVNPFDFWEGANFKLKIRQVEGYRNYDKSEFDAPSQLRADDAELEAIWKAQYSLQAFLAPSEFKTYEALKKQLEKVLGLSNGAPSSVRTEQAPPPAQKTADAPAAPVAQAQSAPADTGAEDDDLSYFKKLAARDS